VTVPQATPGEAARRPRFVESDEARALLGSSRGAGFLDVA